MQNLALTFICLGAAWMCKEADAINRCFSCSGITNPHNCDRIVQCDDSQQCFARSYISDALTVLFDLGCLDNGFCAILPAKKRSAFQSYEEPEALDIETQLTQVDRHVRQKRQKEAPLCTQCCDDSEHCNSDLCPNRLISRPPGLKCYDCGKTLLDDPAECTSIRVCAPGQDCHVTEVISPTGTKFQVNCMSRQLCQAIGNNTSFGRKRDLYLCRTCCAADFCNIDYCSRIRPLPSDTSSGPTMTPTTTTTMPTTTTTTTIITTTTTTPTTTTEKTVPIMFVTTPYNMTMQAGNAPLDYSCEVTGLPAPSISWQFTDNNGNTKDVTSKAKLSGGKSTLTLLPVLITDEGTYTCVANNSQETVEVSGELTVYTNLYLSSTPASNVSPQEGSKLTLECSYDGYPPPSIKWFRVNKSAGTRTFATNLRLENSGRKASLDKVNRTDAGSYECQGDNSYDTKMQQIFIDVLYAPEFLTAPVLSVSAKVNQSIVFNCSASGNPPPKYSFWFIDAFDNPAVIPGVSLDTDGSVMEISKAPLSIDNGTVTCAVANTVGSIRRTADIFITN